MNAGFDMADDWSIVGHDLHVADELMLDVPRFFLVAHDGLCHRVDLRRIFHSEFEMEKYLETRTRGTTQVIPRSLAFGRRQQQIGALCSSTLHPDYLPQS